ncbi:MAG: hypothetical protein NXY57DRAFT_1089645 [Lentinula lateritia]|nr:MAG: hypothetical protein NXY57DRAFT_1089645 [Lentinula lateritia]
MPGNPDSAVQEMLEIMRDIRDMMHSRESSIPAGPPVADEDGAPSPHSGTGDDLPGRDTPAIFNSGENPEEPTCPSSSEHRRAQIISPNPPVEIPGEQSPNTQFTANLSTNSNSPLKHRWFGLKQEKERKVQTHPTAANYDYRVKYPKDPRYHELDEEARVWWVYLDEASDFDNDMVGELGDSLDILLVFAGLFSAVLTTFVAQTSQALSQDYTQLSSSYLEEVTALLRANGNETTLAGIPLTNTAFAPATTDIWLNGLWFISLTLSLSVALFAVLSKQWLRQYMSIITGTPLERVFIRQFRFDGLKKWHVQAIIGVLPVLLHISLVLFLVGLVIFLVPLNTVMAYIVGVITAIVIILYMAASCIPLFIVQCSYRTTFTDILYYIYQLILGVNRWIFYPFRDYLFRFRKDRFPRERAPTRKKPIVVLKEVERSAACTGNPTRNEPMKLKSLRWLGESTTSPSAKVIIRHSLGAFTQKTSDGNDLYTFDALLILYGYRSMLDLIIQCMDLFQEVNVQDNDQLDYLEGQVRACILYPNCRLNFYQMKLDPKIPIPDITVALTLLSVGVIEVPISYDGKTIMLQRDDVLPWILEIYRQSNYDRESELQLPALVWNSLFEWYRDKVGMKVAMQTLHGYLGAHKEYTSQSFLKATEYLSDAIYFRYID